MERTQMIISSLLTITSLAVSSVFFVYGAGILFVEEVPKWVIVFGVVTAAYGLCSVAVLIMAWRSYGAKAKKLISYLAIGFMFVFFFGSLDVGMVSGLEIVGLLFVAAMPFINWLAVSVVVKLKNVA